MSKAEIATAIEQTQKAIDGSKSYVKFLATGQGLPKDDASRQELADSHTRLVHRMELEVEELEIELRGRTP